MDLSTMGAKLEEGHYKDRFAFETDFRIMISNAKQYNVPGSYAHTEAIVLETFFEKCEWSTLRWCLSLSNTGVSVWNRIHKTLEAANKAAEPARKELPSIVVKQLPQKPSQPTRTSTPASVPPPVTADQPAPRPTIKLKVGGAQVKPTEKVNGKLVEKSSEVSKAPKFKTRKLKIPDEAPPPYVDDGSHDLLQEVIAIEREKDEEKRQRRVAESIRESPPAKASGSGPPGKRRKPNVESDGDDVLTFAMPLSRKDKQNGTSSGTGTPVPERPPAPAPKAAPVPPKPKKKGSEPVPTPTPAPEAPRISIKGKEREVTSAQPSKPRATSSTTPLNEKKCRDVLRMISKIPEYSIFSQPVDPVMDGCPT